MTVSVLSPKIKGPVYIIKADLSSLPLIFFHLFCLKYFTLVCTDLFVSDPIKSMPLVCIVREDMIDEAFLISKVNKRG